MKRTIPLIVAVAVLAVLVVPGASQAATRLGLTSGTVFGIEYEPPTGHFNLAYGVGLVEKGGKTGTAIALTKYLGEDVPHTNRPYAAVRLGIIGDGGGFTYAAAAGYSVSMGFMQLLPNVNYSDGKYGVGLGAALQF